MLGDLAQTTPKELEELCITGITKVDPFWATYIFEKGFSEFKLRFNSGALSHSKNK